MGSRLEKQPVDHVVKVVNNSVDRFKRVADLLVR
jgi:hypothetical protein